jgi:hypothetical protein
MVWPPMLDMLPSILRLAEVRRFDAVAVRDLGSGWAA